MQGGVVAMMNLTPSRCMQWCAERRFKYAGVQFSTECYCANSYKGTPTTGCDSTCSGDKYQKCGGVYRNQIYALSADAKRSVNEDDEVGAEMVSDQSPVEGSIRSHRRGSSARSMLMRRSRLQ